MTEEKKWPQSLLSLDLRMSEASPEARALREAAKKERERLKRETAEKLWPDRE